MVVFFVAGIISNTEAPILITSNHELWSHLPQNLSKIIGVEDFSARYVFHNVPIEFLILCPNIATGGRILQRAVRWSLRTIQISQS